MSYFLLIVHVFACTSWTTCRPCALSLRSARYYHAFLLSYGYDCFVCLQTLLLQLLQVPHQFLLIKFLYFLELLKLVQNLLLLFLTASLLFYRWVHSWVMRIKQPLADTYQWFFSLWRSIILCWLLAWRSGPVSILSCTIPVLDYVIQGLYLKSILFKLGVQLLGGSKILRLSISVHTQLAFGIHIWLTLWILDHLKLMNLLLHPVILFDQFLHILVRYWCFLQFLVLFLQIYQFRLNVFSRQPFTL